MKALLVTSEVTFVPENYGRLVLKMAECPQVQGLLILENRELSLLMQGLAFWLSRLAPGIGSELLKNSAPRFQREREEAYQKQGKPVFRLPTVNTPAAHGLFANYDLVINARTRFIYKKDALRAPRLGCINIHHGLLPEQRGVFCDLWALSEKRAAGFSIHRMNEKIDDGEILSVVPVSDGSHQDFTRYILESSEREALELFSLLKDWEQATPRSNARVPGSKHFKNPTVPQIRDMKRKGFRL
jgi:methionyl-tRNA formyltransferase